MITTKKTLGNGRPAEKGTLKGKKPVSEGPIPAQKRLRVLLVDDHKNSLRVMEVVVKGLGHDPKTAASGEEALEIYQNAIDRYRKGYREDGIDLVITDYRMPGMSGFDLLKKLRMLDPEAKVILATAYGKILDKEAIVDAGAIAVLDKPLERDDIKNAIDAVSQNQ